MGIFKLNDEHQNKEVSIFKYMDYAYIEML